jgi:UDP-N-acetylmuramyl pentapeptide phosphotransferase/UDP-N-acetylglucosamine-1-phosphate transferase
MINFTQVLWLLLIFVGCAVCSLLFCGIARRLFPTFRSGEHKPGSHRFDLTIAGREVKSLELPMVGGPSFILAILVTGIVAGLLLPFNRDQWIMMLISMGATLGCTIVGFIDDWRKVHSKQGISEIAKFSGLFLVSIAAAVCYFFLLPGGQESYSFWKDLPILSHLVCAHQTLAPVCRVEFPQAAYFGWFIFLVLLTGCTGTATALAVDFSDGFDGLAGGLIFSAALALGIAVAGLLDADHPEGIVLEVLCLLSAGSILGFLPWCWPSSWAARRNTSVKRHAKIIMGDSGALGMGSLLAMVAIFSRNEFLLLTTIGGVFVIEGLSVIVQRFLVRIYRHHLAVLRFAHTQTFVHHTEFPLPFLAAPLHHHFDLLGWDRRKLVYTAWTLGAVFAVLSVMVSIDTIAWQRYLGRFLAALLMGAIWSTGTLTKLYFVGKLPNQRMRHQRLALYYGFPYEIMGLRLYHFVESIEASEDVIETPAEDNALWLRMNIYDARAMLGLYCYRAGYFPAAFAQWNRIPEPNRRLRPEIERLREEVENRLALEQQETQPIRRDQLRARIEQERTPIFTGNLPPADMPNPHEPISDDEINNGQEKGPWQSLLPNSDTMRRRP